MALYEVVFTGLWWSQLWQNKVHFNSIAPIDAAGVALEMYTNFWGNYKQGMISDVSLVNIAVTRKEGNVLEQHTRAVQETGVHSGEPGNTIFRAGVIQKKTGLAGRKERGRIYAPGIRGGGVERGVLTFNEQQVWNAITGAIKGAFIDPGTSDLRMVIKHPEGFTNVTELTMRPVMGVMRTRNIGVGS